MEITFLTGNEDKINSARKAFEKFPQIDVKFEKVETIEIQSMDVKEVSEFAVKEVANRLKKSVFKVDTGYYFEGLNGYPGALVKFFNKFLTSEDILILLKGKSRKVCVKECLSFCEPEKEPTSFLVSVDATILNSPEGEGGSIDKIIQYEGFEHSQAACDYNDIIEYWNKELNHYERFANYLVAK